jgi:hypothetical protein
MPRFPCIVAAAVAVLTSFVNFFAEPALLKLGLWGTGILFAL